ncbi:Crp/Fnr family transcriptional regulator [Pontibacter kalidii]|uniref:Crp/Fnr family transcriptional regulator n=1 Tax=Pontibacter kalidii TaxID=2592049 RepID=UPI00225770AB|nr:Crp/Fnr family transcriptional regulator [Pontibacter kalidii]
MMKENLLHFLQSTGLVCHQTALEVAHHFIDRKISRNEFFLQEGKVSDEYLFLEEGCLRAFAYDTNGSEVTTGFYTDKQVVFEVSSFFNKLPSKENIKALTDCEGWSIAFAELNHLFHAIPEFREFGRSILVKGFASLKDRMLTMITESAEERYVHLLRTRPELFQHAQLKYIASYLGVTDSSLSRIRKEYSKK